MPTRRRQNTARPSAGRPVDAASAHPTRRKPARRTAQGVTFRRRVRLGADEGEAETILEVMSAPAADGQAEQAAAAPVAEDAAAPAAAACEASSDAQGAPEPASPADAPRRPRVSLPSPRALRERARALLLGPALAARPRPAACAAEGFYVPAHPVASPHPSTLVEPGAPESRLHWAFVVGLAGLLCMAAVCAFTWLMPAQSADAQEYFVPGITENVSMPQSSWSRGTVPAVYQDDERWGQAPYGVTTLGESGAAPCALCMVYVDLTGDASQTPLDFAGWAETARVASVSMDDVGALLTDGAAACGLAAQALDAEPLALRHALGNGQPVVVVTRADTFDDHLSCVVLTGINEHSRLTLVDPTSAERTAQTWSFDEVLDAATAVYAYTRA